MLPRRAKPFSVSIAALPSAFENASARVQEHPAGYVHFTYRPGRRTLDQLEAALTQAASLLEARYWHRILNDQRQVAPFTKAEMAQAHDFWRQRTRQWGHGLWVASILANNLFARIAATTARQRLRQAGVRYQLFEDELPARAWLHQQVVPPPPALS